MKADRAAFERALAEVEKGLPRSSPGRIEREWKLIVEYERQKTMEMCTYEVHWRFTELAFLKMRRAIKFALEAIARHPEKHSMTASEVILREAYHAGGSD